MRKRIAEYIKEDEYLIHADMFNTDKFPTNANVINVGLGESNAINIAGGLASQGKTVYIYGVCGFIIHRLEQLKFSCKHFGAEKGKIIIFNAGKVGYEKFGIGHKLEDDHNICHMIDIPLFMPETLENIQSVLEYIKEQTTGMYYIQLGSDY